MRKDILSQEIEKANIAMNANGVEMSDDDLANITGGTPCYCCSSLEPCTSDVINYATNELGLTHKVIDLNSNRGAECNSAGKKHTFFGDSVVLRKLIKRIGGRKKFDYIGWSNGNKNTRDWEGWDEYPE